MIYSLSLHDALPISYARSIEMDIVFAEKFELEDIRERKKDGPNLELELQEQKLVHLFFSPGYPQRSEEHTSELQSLRHLVCRLLLEKKKKKKINEK